MSLGVRVKEYRQSARLTVAALATASGLTKGFISQVESGKSSPSLASLARIAAALHVPVSWLVSSSAGADQARSSAELALVVARNSYQDKSGVSAVDAPRLGVHFLATLPAYSSLLGPGDHEPGSEASGLMVVLEGRLQLSQHTRHLAVAPQEVAAWNAASRYSIDNKGNQPARLLLFIPDGCPVPLLTSPRKRSTGATSFDAYGAILEGPLRLVAMRARRQAERGR